MLGKERTSSFSTIGQILACPEPWAVPTNRLVSRYSTSSLLALITLAGRFNPSRSASWNERGFGLRARLDPGPGSLWQFCSIFQRLAPDPYRLDSHMPAFMSSCFTTS